MYWDWSTAGMDSVGPNDKYGMPMYEKKKGSFVWAQNVEPEYYWYNETSDRYLMGDKLDPKEVLSLNKPIGNKDMADAKLYPFKVHRGKQIYDTKNNYLIVPKLYGGYWKHFDWNQAAIDGMASVDLPYSGSYGFVSTEMYWKINHMVAPKEKALSCNNCHGGKVIKRIDWKKLGFKGDQIYTKNRE